MQATLNARPSGRRGFLKALSITASVSLLSQTSNALATTPIRLIVPFAAGSSVDILARIVTERIAVNLKIPIVIDNRAGAGGGVGASLASQSPADGNTLFFGTAGTHGINSSLYKRLGYDPIKDFDPVVAISSSSNVLVVGQQQGIKTIEEFIAKAKAAPGTFSMGSGGNGTTPHLSGVLLNRVAGMESVHVPYKSGAILDVIAGRLSYSFESVPSAVPHIHSGKVRALAVTNAQREPMLKDVPTIAESGYPGFQVMAWVGIFAPKGSPSEVIQKVNLASNHALTDSDIIKRLAEIGGTPIGGSSEDLRLRVAEEVKRWPEIVRAANVTLD